MAYDVLQRLDILRFQQTHGMAAACDAFKISCRTLYRWRQALKAANHHPTALTPRSTAPKRRRRSHRPRGQTTPPLECFACDIVERARDGIRRHLFTFINPCSRVAFAWASTTRSRRRSAHALQPLCELMPKPIRQVLSDNGSEFMKDFEAELKQRGITHWCSYSKSPKMNARNEVVSERFNRTCRNHSSIITRSGCSRIFFRDIAGFNRALAQWLVLYNTQRPHQRTSRWGCDLRCNHC